MSVLETLQSRMSSMLSPIYDISGQLVPRQMLTPADVRLYLTEITQVQKNLRLLKTEVSNESKQVSLHYSNQTANVHRNPLADVIFGVKTAGRFSALERQRLRDARDKSLGPYREAAMHIERSLSMLEDLKIKMKRQTL